MTSGADENPLPSDPDEERRYRAVLALEAGPPVGQAALLAALSDTSWRVRAAAVERLAEGDDSPVPALVEALGSEGGAGRRGAAAEALARLGSRAVPSLIGALAAPAWEVRTAAAEVLGRVGDPRGVLPLAERLGDAEANVRVAAAEALGELGGPGAAPALLEALEREDPPLRQAALDALLRLRAAPPLATLEALAADRTLRRSALRLLGLRDEPGAWPLLAEALADRSPAVREAALAGLWQQRARRAPEELEGLAAAVRKVGARVPGLADQCARSLHLGERATAAGALCALRWLADPRQAAAVAAAAEDEGLRVLAAEALEALGAGLRDAIGPTLPDLHPGPRAAALLALARVGDPGVSPLIAAELASDDEPVRSAAIEAAGRLGDVRALPPLCALLGHADPGVSGAAVAALVQMAGRSEGNRSAVLAACRRGRAPGPAVLRLLGRIGDERDVDAVRRGLRTGPVPSRAAAAAALASLGARGVKVPQAPELLEALRAADPVLRAAGARAAGAMLEVGLPWAEATRALAAALGDVEPAVRAAAAHALGRSGARELGPALASLAADSSAPAEVAVAAVQALSRLGDPDPVVLQAAAHHPDPEVVKEAVRAAAGLRGPAAGALLLAAARHPRWDVRRAAAAALGERRDPGLLAQVRRLRDEERDPLVGEALAAAVERLESASGAEP
jgi:HEAT repeat protein